MTTKRNEDAIENLGNQQETPMNNYSEYTVTVKTDESYYGSDVTRDEAHEIAAKITTALEAQFPGINVRQCDMIGYGQLDETSGPDSQVCDEIDRAATFHKSVVCS